MTNSAAKPSANAKKTTFLDVAGKKTQVTVGGEGPPLVWLHSAAGETEWMKFHKQLAKTYKLYLPALPGFALSEGLDRIDDMADYAWHTIDLFDQLELKGVPVVGFSLGGWLALEIALLRPDLISKIVLVDAAGLYVPEARMAELFIDDFDKMRKLLFFDPESAAVAEAMPLSLEDPRILMWLRAREATARVGWNPYLHNPKLRQHLHRITCPVQILWGRQDHLIPLAHGETYAELLPNATLQVFEDCGHMLPHEQSEEMTAAIREFVSE
jgi:pimeloyl-ACP methyl ester carboxylesterase